MSSVTRCIPCRENASVFWGEDSPRDAHLPQCIVSLTLQFNGICSETSCIARRSPTVVRPSANDENSPVAWTLPKSSSAGNRRFWPPVPTCVLFYATTATSVLLRNVFFRATLFIRRRSIETHPKFGKISRNKQKPPIRTCDAAFDCSETRRSVSAVRLCNPFPSDVSKD